MKKLLALLLTGTMVLSLGACGGGGSDSGSGAEAAIREVQIPDLPAAQHFVW